MRADDPLEGFPAKLVRVRDTPKPPPFLEADLQKAVIDTRAERHAP